MKDTRIIVRNRVPCDSTLHVWVVPDKGSEDSFSALARLVDNRSKLIWDEIDLEVAKTEQKAKRTILKCPKSYVLAVKVDFFVEEEKSATIFHKIVKVDGTIYGKTYSHKVPVGVNKDGRQTIAIKMVQKKAAIGGQES